MMRGSTWIAMVAGAILAPIAEAAARPPAAQPSGSWHGLVYTCGRHPPVLVLVPIVIAYEPNLTDSIQGQAVPHGSSVTLSFPSRYESFTITKRGSRYLVDGRRCVTDPV